MVVLNSTTNGDLPCPSSFAAYTRVITIFLIYHATGCPVKFMVCSEANVCKHFFGNAHPIISKQSNYRLVECSLCRLHSRYSKDSTSSLSTPVPSAQHYLYFLKEGRRTPTKQIVFTAN